jgi:hypothetical protein
MRWLATPRPPLQHCRRRPQRLWPNATGVALGAVTFHSKNRVAPTGPTSY